MTSSHTESASPHIDGDMTRVQAAFEDFLRKPWPLPGWQMSERKRLWLAFDAGAQFAIDSIRAALPLRDAQSDEERSHG